MPIRDATVDRVGFLYSTLLFRRRACMDKPRKAKTMPPSSLSTAPPRPSHKMCKPAYNARQLELRGERAAIFRSIDKLLSLYAPAAGELRLNEDVARRHTMSGIDNTVRRREAWPGQLFAPVAPPRPAGQPALSAHAPCRAYDKPQHRVLHVARSPSAAPRHARRQRRKQMPVSDVTDTPLPPIFPRALSARRPPRAQAISRRRYMNRKTIDICP